MRATKGSEDVFADCGFPPAEAENLRIRAKMMMALTGYIRERKITQSRAARIMGVSQPRISDLVRGKIGLFTIDTLVNMVTAAGLKVDVDITAGGRKRRASRLPDSWTQPRPQVRTHPPPIPPCPIMMDSP